MKEGWICDVLLLPLLSFINLFLIPGSLLLSLSLSFYASAVSNTTHSDDDTTKDVNNARQEGVRDVAWYIAQYFPDQTTWQKLSNSRFTWLEKQYCKSVHSKVLYSNLVASLFELSILTKKTFLTNFNCLVGQSCTACARRRHSTKSHIKRVCWMQNG